MNIAAKKATNLITSLLLIGVIAFTIAMQHRWNRSLVWQHSSVITAQPRGADGAILPSAYREDDLLALATLLEKSVTARYEEAQPSRFNIAFKSKAHFAMAASIAELHAGALEIGLTARTPSGDATVKEWREEFDSKDAYLAAVDALGARIASDLSALREH